MYGVSSYKICASCSDFDVKSSEYQEFCGKNAYGYDAVVSGLLFLPVDIQTNEIQDATLKISLWVT